VFLRVSSAFLTFTEITLITFRFIASSSHSAGNNDLRVGKPLFQGYIASMARRITLSLSEITPPGGSFARALQNLWLNGLRLPRLCG